MRWLITGANGNLGKRLVRELLNAREDEVVAVVRSSTAKQALESLNLESSAQARLTVCVLDYTDVEALRAVAENCTRAVHLVGILKESRTAKYVDAHQASTAALVQALEGSTVTHLTYMSIVGSHAESANACLASKGEAEQICCQAAVKSCVLRVPMVLGEGDYASYALRARASKWLSFTFRAVSQEQPIYAGDVVQGIVNAGRIEVDESLDLGGPEVLTRKVLTQRAATILGTKPRVISLPLGLGVLLATCLEKVLANPPMTAAMLKVLDHDDDINAKEACARLNLADLTSLDETLTAVLR